MSYIYNKLKSISGIKRLKKLKLFYSSNNDYSVEYKKYMINIYKNKIREFHI